MQEAALALTPFEHQRKEVFLMGRKNKAYSKTLHQQAYDKLTSMQSFGESKKEAMKNGTDKEKYFLLTPIKVIGNI